MKLETQLKDIKIILINKKYCPPPIRVYNLYSGHKDLVNGPSVGHCVCSRRMLAHYTVKQQVERWAVWLRSLWDREGVTASAASEPAATAGMEAVPRVSRYSEHTSVLTASGLGIFPNKDTSGYYWDTVQWQ